MTGETEDKTVPWVEKHGMKYAYGYLDKGAMGGFMSKLGMRGYPSAALVGADGKVVWTGHPAGINGSLIKEHIGKADPTPVGVGAVVRDWPKEADAARKAFAKGKLADAREAAANYPEEWGVAASINKVIERRVSTINSLHSSGDFLGFTEAVKASSKSLKGLEEFAAIEATLEAVKKDKAAKAVISAQKKLRRLKAKANEIRKPKEVPPVEKMVRKLAEKHAGTHVEKAANSLLKTLEGKKKQRRR